MKKVLFGIFAHPDDEAFGPSGTLFAAANSGTDVHLILITDGECGNNPDSVANLNKIRLIEWEESRKRIGAITGTALHYPDGGLCNKLYLEIAEKILFQVNATCRKYHEEITIDFLTFDQDGISGHLDHIAVSYISTYVYLKLRQDPPSNTTIGLLKYFNLCRDLAHSPNTNWLYMPAGKHEDEIDEVFDYLEVIDQKRHIMKAHQSQREDMKTIIKMQDAASSKCTSEHFRYYKD